MPLVYALRARFGGVLHTVLCISQFKNITFLIWQ